MRFCVDFLMESKIFTGIMSGGMNFSTEMLLFLPPRSLTLIMTNPLVEPDQKNRKALPKQIETLAHALPF